MLCCRTVRVLFEALTLFFLTFYKSWFGEHEIVTLVRVTLSWKVAHTAVNLYACPQYDYVRNYYYASKSFILTQYLFFTVLHYIFVSLICGSYLDSYFL